MVNGSTQDPRAAVREEVERELDQIIRGLTGSAYGRPTAALEDGTELVADLMLDSLDFVSLMTEVDERWALDIPDEDISVRRFATVGSLRAYVCEALAQRAESR